MIDQITQFIVQTLHKADKQKAVIGVSGGIDSAVALTLLTRALGSKWVMPILLPYGDQDLTDSRLMLKFNQIPEENWQIKDIKPVIEVVAQVTAVAEEDRVRLGNLMARTRMMMLYDLAKKKQALVCGTENKSEKYLGYFTRFGDEASDLEPIVHLYKTQVRQLAKELGLPSLVITKSPSAGLWPEQTDEQELGFSYKLADQVLVQLIDKQKPVTEIEIDGVERVEIEKVIQRVEQMKFKQQVPYLLEKV